jgi:hypothetical protein
MISSCRLGRGGQNKRITQENGEPRPHVVPFWQMPQVCKTLRAGLLTLLHFQVGTYPRMVLHIQASDFEAPASPAVGGRVGSGGHEQQHQGLYYSARFGQRLLQ